ncbi:acyl carrier protein [Mycobacterium sp. MS1601]|uniref:acyl carrier protein n=1 Tax=Mycobacterium sp. MS1601 TaxID=1936029 RepID=UPI0009791B05|nr:acyl carrier protein [Mycobacterium sp. MS1601]AQA04404.1 acyl carrier protein [Mycobacterium sp. MS1601]
MEPSSRPTISAELTEILCEDLRIDVSRIRRESRLISDVCLDWIGFAIAVVAIEDKLRIHLSEQDLLSINTIGDLDDILHVQHLIESLSA